MKTIIDAVRVKERNLIGHGERIQREEEGLKESLQNAFAGNLDVYFKDELSALKSAYEDTIQSNMSVAISSSSSKWLHWLGSSDRNELRAALKSLCPEGSSEETIKLFVTGCLSSITIVELFNVTSRSIDILDCFLGGLWMVLWILNG